MIDKDREQGGIKNAIALGLLAGMRELAIDKNMARLFYEVAVIGHEHGYVAFGTEPDGKWPYRDQFADDLGRVLSEMRDNGEIDQLIVSYLSY